MNMRTIKTILFALAATLVFASCSKDANDSGSYVDALVTVKENTAGNCILQLDDQTIVVPTNVTKNPYQKEVRALASLYFEDGKIENEGNVKIMYMDSILTKKLVPAVDNNKEYYGNDPVEIYSDWLTVAEDGYVTIHFATNGSANPNKAHWVNLVKGEDPTRPNELVFHHKLDGVSTPNPVDGIVAFNIREILPVSNEKTDITIRFESFTGPKSFTLKAQGNKE